MPTKKPSAPPSKRKTKQPADHAWYTKWWCHSFKSVTGSKYAYTGKAAGIIKQMLDQVGLDELVARSCVYLTMSPAARFPRGAPTIEGMQCMINQVADAVSPEVGDKSIRLGIFPEKNIPIKQFQPWDEKQSA